MSASNTRTKEYETVHHLVSRIAHRVYFLGEEERNEFLEMIRRTAEYSGLQLLAWCIMANHFHLLVHLPAPVELSEDEILRRYAALKGRTAGAAAQRQLANWVAEGRAQRADEWFDAQRRRMYDVGEFMKTIKQWFTEEYNRRQKHTGTLWESVYHDHLVPKSVKDMSRVAGYIHLNPVRAAATDTYDGYAWSSFAALAKGDRLALAGLRFIHGEEKASAKDLAARHTVLLDALLEGIKRQRAEEICRKRMAGYELPADPLTTEAMVAQAAAHLNEVQNALIEFHATRDAERRTLLRRRDVTDEVFLAALASNPNASPDSLSQMLGLSVTSVYDRLRKFRKSGLISRTRRSAGWVIYRKIGLT